MKSSQKKELAYKFWLFIPKFFTTSRGSKPRIEMEEKVFETDGLQGTYTVQDVKESRYILYSCARKTVLLPSNTTVISGLTKEKFNWAIESNQRNMYQPLERLLGAPNSINAIFALTSGYPVKVLQSPQYRPDKI